MIQSLIRRIHTTQIDPTEASTPIDEDQQYRSALNSVRKWAWLLLVIWSTVSVAANGFHAFLVHSATLSPLATTLVGVIPPIALIGITELVARLVRLSQYTRRLAWVVVATLFLSLAIAMLIGAAAFAMSFAAVRDFAIMCGVSSSLAGLVPFIIDFSVIASAVAIVAESIAATSIGERTDPRGRNETPAPTQQPRRQQNTKTKRLTSVPPQDTAKSPKPATPPTTTSAAPVQAPPQPAATANATAAAVASVTRPAHTPLPSEIAPAEPAAAEAPAATARTGTHRRSTPRVHRTTPHTSSPRLVPVDPESDTQITATRRTGGMIMPKRVAPVVTADAV